MVIFPKEGMKNQSAFSAKEVKFIVHSFQTNRGKNVSENDLFYPDHRIGSEKYYLQEDIGRVY